MKKILLSLSMFALYACNADESLENFLGFTDATPEAEEQFDGTFTPEQLKLKYGKKGACFTLRSVGSASGTVDVNMPKIIKLNAKWNYSWGTTYWCDQDDETHNQPDAIEFMPLYFGGGNEDFETTRSSVQTQIDKGKLYRVLAANEPDKEDQSNKTVDEQIAAWPALEALGVPLGSPATAANPATSEWFQEFWKKAMELEYRVDYICVHSYGGVGVDAFKTKMQGIYDMYQRPLLITEFAVADWTASTPEANKYTPAQVLAFMKEILPWLEAQDWIAGYAWFSFGVDSGPGTSSALFTDSTGSTFTELGEYYANFVYNPDEYEDGGSEETPEEGYSLNMVKNGDFENLAEEWIIENNVDFITIDAHNDDKIQLINDETTLMLVNQSEGGSIKQIISGVVGGKTYEYEFIGRSQSEAGGQGTGSSQGTLKMTILAGDGSTELSEVSIESNMNTTKVGTFTLADNYAYSTLHVVISKDAGIAYADDVKLREKTEVVKEPITSISLANTVASITVNGTLSPPAVNYAPETASAPTVEWSITSGSEYLSINSTTGVMTGKAEGEATVIATAKGVGVDGADVVVGTPCTVTIRAAETFNPAGNLILNGGFSSILGSGGSGYPEHWTRPASNFNVDTPDQTFKMSGSYIRFSGATASSNISQYVTVEPGATYKFGFTGAFNASNGDKITMSLRNGDTISTILTSVVLSKDDMDEGQETVGKVAEATFQIPGDYSATGNKIQVYIAKASGVCGIDNVFLIKQ